MVGESVYCAVGLRRSRGHDIRFASVIAEIRGHSRAGCACDYRDMCDCICRIKVQRVGMGAWMGDEDKSAYGWESVACGLESGGVWVVDGLNPGNDVAEAEMICFPHGRC